MAHSTWLEQDRETRRAESHAFDSHAREPAESTNVGHAERLLSAGAGALLMGIGMHLGKGRGAVAALAGASLVHRGVSGNCWLYKKLGVSTEDSTAARGTLVSRGVNFEGAVSVLRPREELYRFWRDFSNLPQLMDHLSQVVELPGDRSRWTATGPMGTQLEWDAELINDRAGELIAWRSLPGSQIDSAGSVRFEDATEGRGTVVRITMKYDPPGGLAGATIARLMGAGVEAEVRQALGRFKQLMEAGEVATIAGQPQGSCGGVQ